MLQSNKMMTDRSQPLQPEKPASDTADENPLTALEADARDSIAKALYLFENGEKDVAEHMFERLRQRVLQAAPTAMLVSGSDNGEDRAELQSLVRAISDVALLKPEDGPDSSEGTA